MLEHPGGSSGVSVLEERVLLCAAHGLGGRIHPIFMGVRVRRALLSISLLFLLLLVITACNAVLLGELRLDTRKQSRRRQRVEGLSAALIQRLLIALDHDD
jgi:hypothetical protein